MSKKREFDNLIKMINKECDEEIASAIKEIDKTRAERIKSAGLAFRVNTAKLHIKNGEKTAKKAEKPLWRKEEPKVNFTQADKIREAITKLDQQNEKITAKKVTEYVQQFFPDSKHTSISTSLIRMSQKTHLNLIRNVGKEGKEVIYEKM